MGSKFWRFLKIVVDLNPEIHRIRNLPLLTAKNERKPMLLYITLWSYRFSGSYRSLRSYKSQTCDYGSPLGFVEFLIFQFFCWSLTELSPWWDLQVWFFGSDSSGWNLQVEAFRSNPWSRKLAWSPLVKLFAVELRCFESKKRLTGCLIFTKLHRLFKSAVFRDEEGLAVNRQSVPALISNQVSWFWSGKSALKNLIEKIRKIVLKTRSFRSGLDLKDREEKSWEKLKKALDEKEKLR